MYIKHHRSCYFALAILSPIALAAQETLPAGARTSPIDRVDIQVGAHYAGLISGTAQAQEAPLPNPNAPSYDLKKDLGVQDGYTLFAKVSVALTKNDALSASILQTKLSGKEPFETPVFYNDTIIQPGQIETKVKEVIGDLLYHRQFVFPVNPAWRLELNGGARLFQGLTKIRSRSDGEDQEEWRAILVPTLGAALSYQAADRWTFGLAVSGSGPGDVFGIAAEPADVWYWTAEPFVTYRISRHVRLQAGVFFSGLDLHFKGEEVDHVTFGDNTLRTLSVEPSFSINVAF